MDWRSTCVLMAVLAAAGGVVDGAGNLALGDITPGRILVLAPFGPRSHINFILGIIDALTQHDHQVTLVSSQKIKERANVREVLVEGMDLDYSKAFVDKSGAMQQVAVNMPYLCADALGQQQVQDLLKEEFDVILINFAVSQCFLSFVHQMKVPFVWLSPLGMYTDLYSWSGNPPFLSLGPANVVLEMRHPLTFGERILNIVAEHLGNAFMWFIYNIVDYECRNRGLCPSDMPPISVLANNASLAMINSVRTMEYPPRPLVPGIISVGGIHCRPARALPKELEEWVQGAGEAGFIFFSLGSSVKSSDMPEEYRQVLVQVFGMLKQRVLWKWEKDTMPDLPPNVRVVKWLPQQDILGHPSLRLFITHGGKLSTYEAAYHGVPILGLPVFLDQQRNMMHVAIEGWGQVISWEHLTQEVLAQTIQDIMANQSMAAKAERQRSVMVDQPQLPGDVAAYWVEYVMRHQGAPHLRSPILDMYWYEVYNVDVWLAVVVVTAAVLYLIFTLAVAVCRCLWTTKKHKSE